MRGLEGRSCSPVGSEVGCSLGPKDSNSRVISLPIQDAAEAGTRSGYRGRRSPHTPHERFEGLTVLKAAQVREEAPMPWSDAWSWRGGYAGGWAPAPGLLLWRGSPESLQVLCPVLKRGCSKTSGPEFLSWSQWKELVLMDRAGC